MFMVVVKRCFGMGWIGINDGGGWGSRRRNGGTAVLAGGWRMEDIEVEAKMEM